MSGKGDADTRSPNYAARAATLERIYANKKPTIWHDASTTRPESMDERVWVKLTNGKEKFGPVRSFPFDASLNSVHVEFWRPKS